MVFLFSCSEQEGFQDYEENTKTFPSIVKHNASESKPFTIINAQYSSMGLDKIVFENIA